MSRYDWPATPKKRQRGLERLNWDARTSGIMTERMVHSGRVARAHTRVPFDAPEGAPVGDTNVWLPIGPSMVILESLTDRPRVSGRVRDVAVSPDGTRAYAATAGGGVWYTGDSGVSWSPIGNWSPTPSVATFSRGANALTCGCLLVIFGAAPSGANDVVYVGTGEIRDSFAGTHVDQVAGVGVLQLAVPLPDALAQPFDNPWKREAPNLVGRGIFRLAINPNDPTRLVAATSMGLFTRRGVFEEDRPWSRVTAGPFDFDADDEKWTTDVMWSSAGRLWVALIDDTRFSDTGVYVSSNGVAGPFEEIDLDGIDEPRDPRIGIAIAPSDPSIAYVLASGPKVWRINGNSGRRVQRIPKQLFGGNDQSQYDLAIAVDPRNPNRVVLGGAGSGFNAMMFQLDVGTDADGKPVTDFDEDNQGHPEKDLTFIGKGVHADVHAVCFVDVPGAAAPHLWIACDGGVFRSTSVDRRQRFSACNTGLAALQCGYVASHPTAEGLVFTGTQDNGILIRDGDTVWLNPLVLGGDGGNVLVHPVQSRFAVGHIHNGEWRGTGAFTPPLSPRAAATTATEKAQQAIQKALKAESNAAAFYSAGDIRQIGDKVQIALGTNRVWLADNWDPTGPRAMSWYTLPSSTDPYEDGGTDVKQDTFKGGVGQVIACRWASDNRLVVLCQRAVLLFDRDDDQNWERKVLSYHDPKCDDLDNDDISAGPSEWVPPVGSWTDLAIYDNDANGRFYVATTSHLKFDDNSVEEFDRMDTLWWYDGTSRYHHTGLRNRNSPPDDVGTEAPALAVTVDPDDKNIVYVGTAIGVWRGVLTFAGTTPQWKWQPFSNGLPETAVHDLSFFNHSGLKLLRAALGSRGVWEVDLSASPRPVARTYLRVHKFDTRRRALTSLINPQSEDSDDVLFEWYVSPDLRIRPAQGGPVPRSPDGSLLRWNSQPTPFDRHALWAFQTAFRTLQPLCRPNGRWTEQFESLLKVQFGQVTAEINEQIWNTVVTAGTVFTPPWGTNDPTEADLYELIVEPGSQGPSIPVLPFLERQRVYHVDVLVHHRDQRPVRADQVRVTLLRRPLTGPAETWGNVVITTGWKGRVQELLSGDPLPAGWGLDDGWRTAGIPILASPRGPIDARTPRTVTFTIDFTGLTGPPGLTHHVLLAIVHSDQDPVTVASLAGSTLQELVEFSHHVAARVALVN